MPKIIHVPQGYSARLTREQMLQYDISGLHTDGFSTCNILIGISKNKLVLMHIDTNTLNSAEMLDQMQLEIEWMEEPREIIVAFRNVDGGGRNVNMSLLFNFELRMPFVRVVEKEIDNNTQGVYLSFDAQRPGDIHTNIQKFPLHVRPEGLIHHPQERQLLAVQKIEQVIGQQERLVTGATKNKQFCIFNGGWEVLKEVALKVDTSHPITMNEMLLFSREDTYPHIIKKLMLIINDSRVPYRGDVEAAVLFIAPYFEEYLNNYSYDYIALFKRGLKQMATLMEHSKPQLKTDKDFERNLVRLLTKKDDVFDETRKLMDEYKHKAPETELKEMMVGGYTAFAEHYQDRKYYYDLKQSYLQMRKDALRYNEDGLRNYKGKNYQLAASSFLEVIKLYTFCCVKSEPNLATTYYNYGQSLGKNGDYQRAVIFIRAALELRENYTQPEPAKQELEKTRAALKAYKEKLEIQAFNVTLPEEVFGVKQDDNIAFGLANNVLKTKTLLQEGEMALSPTSPAQPLIFSVTMTEPGGSESALKSAPVTNRGSGAKNSMI